MEQKLETRCEKNLCLKFSPKNLYFTKTSLYEKPLFSKEPARGRASISTAQYDKLAISQESAQSNISHDIPRLVLLYGCTLELSLYDMTMLNTYQLNPIALRNTILAFLSAIGLS